MDKKLQRGIIAVLIANIINVFFSLATNFLLPKYLSIEDYAGIKEFQLYVSYVGLFHFGFVDGIYLKYGGKNLQKKVDNSLSTELSTMRLFQLLITIIVLITSIVIRDYILMFFAISILPQNMANYFKFLYQATGEFELYGKAMNLTTISTFILNMILLFIFRIENMFWYILGYVTLFFMIWVILEKNFHRKHQVGRGEFFSLSALCSNVKSGFLLTLGNLSSIFLTSMDRWFVKVLLNTVAFAEYSFAVSVENFLNLAITPVTTTLYNYFCRENSVELHKKVYNYIVVFATVIPIAAFPVQFILDTFLKKYAGASKIVFILFSAQMFYTVIKAVYVNLYKVQRKQKVYFTKLIIVLIVGFIFNYLCYRIMKSKEAFAVGTLLSAVVWFILSEVDFKYIRSSVGTYLYLFFELAFFLIIGFYMSPILGVCIYLLATLILGEMLMNQTFRDLRILLIKLLRRINGEYIK